MNEKDKKTGPEMPSDQAPANGPEMPSAKAPKDGPKIEMKGVKAATHGHWGLDTPSGYQKSRKKSVKVANDILKDSADNGVEIGTSDQQITVSEEFYAGTAVPDITAIGSQFGTSAITGQEITETAGKWTTHTKETLSVPGPTT